MRENLSEKDMMPGTLQTIWSVFTHDGRSRRPVDVSHVDCPYDGRVSVDRCLVCDRLRDIKLDGESGWVACGGTDPNDPTLLYRPMY
jgi:hypothetical protein